ncbi:hypothetical protein [Micromonospora zhanjiangensis]
MWPQDELTWRWRYRSGKIELTSNQSYLSRSAAEEAARTAYRGRSVTLLERSLPATRTARGRLRRAARATGRGRRSPRCSSRS